MFSVWVAWIMYVNWQVGEPNAYWQVRAMGSVPLYRGPFTFLYLAASTFVYAADPGEKLRYLTALVIPIIQLFIAITVPLRDEAHRLAIIVCILAVLFVTFYIANPNKVIVYSTTFPGHFAVGVLFLKQTIFGKKLEHQSIVFHSTKMLSGLAYMLYCSSLLVFFILGTPLEWYY
jgi:hypothetical protein